MFEVLVYLFENYFEVDVRPDHSTLEKELFAAGFETEDINGAFDWFNALETMSADAGMGLIPSQGFRVFGEAEIKKIDSECFSFLLFLEQAKVIDASQRELVIDRAMALPQNEVGIEELRWIVLMALWNQGKANDFLFVEDAVFADQAPILH